MTFLRCTKACCVKNINIIIGKDKITYYVIQYIIDNDLVFFNIIYTSFFRYHEHRKLCSELRIK